MNQTKQQIEQLEREHEALDKVIRLYHAYNEYRLVETATKYLETKRNKVKQEKMLTDTVVEGETLEKEIEENEVRQQTLEQQEEVLEQKQKRLEKHEVWSLEEERKKELHNLKMTDEEVARKEQSVTDKMKDELKTKDRFETTGTKIAVIETEMKNQVTELTMDAEEAAFDRHEINVQDFIRNQETDFAFTMWKKEAEAHYERLDEISEQLREYDQTKERIAEIEKVIASTQMEMDQAKQEQTDWENIFIRDKQEKINEIHQWIEAHPYFAINDETVQQSIRMMEQLYEPVLYEHVRDLYTQVKNNYVLRIQEQIAYKSSQKTQILEEKQEQEELLETWKQTKDPELPNQRSETKAARTKLIEGNIAFLPFYEAVEFQAHVTEDVRKHLEAAIMDVGLIDALITNEDISIQHDRLIKTNPQMMAHTLADYLKPDLADDASISAELVDDVLRSIVIESEQAEDGFSINTDGTYTIGLMEGHAALVDQVQFIGKNARQRYRETQIAEISAYIEELTGQLNILTNDIGVLQEKITAANIALANFPDDADLKVSYDEIKKYTFTLNQLESQLIADDARKNEVVLVFHELKRKLATSTQNVNIEFTFEAYQEAKSVQRQYEKEVSNLEKMHASYLHHRQNEVELTIRLKELEEEVDELKGEQNILYDRKTRTEQHIAAIEKQLQIQGMDEVRAQIQQVQEAMETTKEALQEMRMLIPQQYADQKTIKTKIAEHKQKLQFQKVMIDAWEDAYSVELSLQFVSIPNEVPTDLDERAKWIVKQFAYRPNERTKIEEQLSKVFYEQHSNLMEYRMTETVTAMPKVAGQDGNWTEEQHIMINDWRNKAQRRIIQLDFQGKRLSPYYVMNTIEKNRSRQQTLLNDQDRQLYEDILFDSVGKKLRSRITRAQQWTKKMNELMLKSDSTSGIRFSIQWKPRTAETEAELDTKELVDLLRRDARLLKEEDLEQVMNHFRSRINRAKELIEIQGEGSSLLQVLKEVLDYRYWFSFVLSYQRVGEPKRELTNNAFYKFSGGEKAMAMYIPLFTACYSRYLEADESAPYIISLDEAFAGVDDDNISAMFNIVEELQFDYMMNSQILWGDYDTVSALSIYELIRPKNADFVSVIRYKWDGKTRRLIDDEEEANGIVEEKEKEESLLK